MSTQTFAPRTIILRSQQNLNVLLGLANNLPIDEKYPLEVAIRKHTKVRKPSQNAAMWTGPLKDIEDQVFIDGVQYNSKVWHDYFKRQFLPEEFDPELCKEGYEKWKYAPDGERVLVGSTTQLTRKGFAEHMMQIEAFGASKRVQFRVNPKQISSYEF